jgi:hypothetical protein
VSDEDKVTDAEIKVFYQAEDDHERHVHFNGEHVQDPPQHGDCVDSCPYDTDEQAAERIRQREWAERREAEAAAEDAAEDAVREAEAVAWQAADWRQHGGQWEAEMNREAGS